MNFNNSKDVKRIIEGRIEEFIVDFKNSPDRFLTEEDVRCHLYHLLLKDFNYLQETADKSRSIPLHAEVRFYGISGRLKFRADIVIFDPSTLRTKNKGAFRVPSKGYSFEKPWAVIEVKLRRNKSREKFRRAVLQDRRKIESIRNESSHPFYSFILAIDKKSNADFTCLNNQNHTEFYCTLE